MGTIMDINGRDLVDTEEDQEEMERIHRRTAQERSKWTDGYNGVVSHPEPAILGSEVKRALGSTAVNKLVDAMEFQ